MAFMYFDESIRNNGQFIIGALVVAKEDLSPLVHKALRSLGLDPTSNEYKSSDPKENSATGHRQREIIREILFESKLAFTVLPVGDRGNLGECCIELTEQLNRNGFLSKGDHHLYLDQNIKVTESHRNRLTSLGVVACPNSDSRLIGGLQVADHAAHALGGMLLEEMGLITKQVRAGENSGYHPDELLDLGFELWASLRYAIIGRNEYIEGLSPPPDDPANPDFRVDGVGLYVAPSCPQQLAAHARKRFGVNYLGCIH